MTLINAPAGAQAATNRALAGAQAISLDDRYNIDASRIFLSGTQALVRLALVQQARDAADGLKTAGFVSGYRGSPLGGLDLELWRAQKRLAAADVLFVPGINEELGATAVWGSQMTALNPSAQFDGVFGLWYGKGPGLDRAMDVLKHANAAGTSRHGGVLAIVGDDHGAKSSTLPHQSDHNFSAAFVPFLAPASVHEFVEYGLLGLAMSRFAGTWVGFKATADTVETSATVDTANEKRSILFPAFEFPEGGVHIRANDIWRDEDTRLQRFKGFAAMAFARANGIDRLIWDTPRPRFGILSTGKAFADTMEALDELGIDARVAADIGLRLYKVGMPWPLEPQGVRAFAEGLEEVLVIEEKREFIEHQLKWQLYNWKPGVRPVVVGKQDEAGEWLLSPDNELTPGMIAKVIARRLSHFHKTDRIENALAFFEKREALLEKFTPPTKRTPYFCAGCPHNTSTRVPEGSRALAGIGCHIMALWMDRAQTFTQMGGEGVTWVGEAPFVGEKHVFANLGDGTYEHSGLLAIRQAIAANANITYKILFNDAVAMTGGQPVEGQLTVGKVARQMLAEGAKKVWVLSEEPDKLQGQLPAGVDLLHRDALATVSQEAIATPGCTVIIYDQTCATEKRRRRKRGLMADPDRRVIINPQVCEGCGDCSVQSNCVSVEPLATEFGRKRQINQSVCNKDFSCVKGFCPSFVTVEGVALRKPAPRAMDLSGLPDPVLPALDRPANILVTGIGGTGVLTISALLGMAGHLAGIASTTADMAGLAQKGGAVWSYVRLAASNDQLVGPRIMTGSADLVLACDCVVAADKVAQNLMAPSRTHVVANADVAPTADFVRNRDIDFHTAQVKKVVSQASRAHDFIAAEHVAVALMGDAIAANVMLMGFAWQKGLIPLPFAAIDAAIELNGVAVPFNRQAFAAGRMLAHDPARLAALIEQPAPLAVSLDERIDTRARDLAAWGNAAWATRYRDLVEMARRAETAVRPGSEALAEAVARSAHKLMAYKDEYEVARLMTDGRFAGQMDHVFSKAQKRTYHLSPPIFARTDPATGRPKKYAMPGWLIEPLFRVLASMKGLRGTPFDIFGRTEERRHEREAIPAFEAEVERLVTGLNGDNLALAAEIARLPLDVRGFGPVKEDAATRVAERRQSLWARWQEGMQRAA